MLRQFLHVEGELTMRVLAKKCLLMLLVPLACSGTAAQAAPTADEFVRFYRPLDVLVTDRCVHYWHGGFGPILKERLAAALQRGADKRATVKALLLEYDDTARAMCADVKSAYLAHPDVIAAVYRYPNIFGDGTVSGTLEADNAVQWSRDNAAFTRESAHIPALFYLALTLGREFVEWPFMDEGAKEHDAVLQVEMESKQCGAGDERKLIFGLARDKGFASLLPRRYDMMALAREEARLRQECQRLGVAFKKNMPPAPRAPEGDLENNLDITPIYEKYRRKMVDNGR